MEYKRKLRIKYLKQRNNLKKDIIESLSGSIQKNIYETEIYKKANNIFVYINTNSEVETINIIKKSWNDNKKVGVPVLTGNKNEMFFAQINDFECLKKNKYGIYEPEINKNNFIKSDNTTLILVPGLVFSKDKFRIGYGGGYYDKYLSENNSLANMALAYSFQIVDKLIVQDNDVKLDFIVTEKGVF